MTSLHQILTPFQHPTSPIASPEESPQAFLGGGDFDVSTFSQSDISPGLETRIQKMSWRPWKVIVTGRSEEVNELEERKFSSLSRSDMDMMTRRSRTWEKKYGKGTKHVTKLREEEAEKKRIKDEKHHRQGTATKRPHWAVKRAFAPPKQRIQGMEVVCRKVRWWSGWATSVEEATMRG